MAIDQATVRKIASLARIAISDAEAAAMEGELNGILGWVEQLGQVDVTGVEPMTAVIPNTLRLRDDIVDADPLTGGGRRQDVLANAPEPPPGRSEERSVGKEGVSRCRSRGSRWH